VRTTALVPDQATARCDEWGAGTPGGALGRQGRALVPVCQEECALECRSGGGVLGAARGKRVAVPGHGERLDGKEPEAISVTPRRPDGPLRECQAHRDGLSVEACAEGLAPGLTLFRALCKPQTLTVCRASGLAADSVLRRSPVEANTGRTCFGGLWLPG